MKNILITGSSKGIGKYLKDNLEGDYKILSISRSDGIDLTKKDDILDFGKKIGLEYFDTIILNAGVAEFGDFEENSLDSYENIINLNLLANIRLLKILEKNIKESTKIVFMGSIISKKFMKNASVYQASKFAIRGFAGGLKKEGKKIFLINPKIVETDFHKGKISLDYNLPKTSLESILEVVKNIVTLKEKRFEIDL